MHFYLCIASLLIKADDINIDSLFYKWNKATLRSLENSLSNAAIVGEKELYQNRLEAEPVYWDIETDSMNKESIRWKFLEQICKEFNPENNNWTVVEVVKSGEVVRIINYLICYDSSGAKIITYRYLIGGWSRVEERYADIKMRDLALTTARVSFESGSNNYDAIVTNFKSGSILQSEYFLNSTLSEKSKIVSIIN
ncbi:hypothetical protein SAMN05518672_102249 [Chitinophaga sp. CF118]|nr:hypothetical protein SAMN05518672_102249 [Chitinophaga sp. CF118]